MRELETFRAGGARTNTSIARNVSINDKITVYPDLSAAPFSNVTRWSHKEFYGDHSRRQPTQPPGEWSNFTFIVPRNTTGVQLTSRYSSPRSGDETSRKGVAVAERVVHWEVQGYVMEVGVVWWGKSWRMYIGLI